MAYELEEFWRREPDPKTDAGDLKAPSIVVPVDREHVWQILQAAGRPPAESQGRRQPYAGALPALLCLDVHKKTVVAYVDDARGTGDPYL